MQIMNHEVGGHHAVSRQMAGTSGEYPGSGMQRIVAMLALKTTLRRPLKSGQAALGRHLLNWLAIPLLTKKLTSPSEEAKCCAGT
jgi:hypothetical protein